MSAEREASLAMAEDGSSPQLSISEDATLTTTSNDDGRTGRTTFTIFEKLPTELRHEIWKIAAFEPRNICISATKLGRLELYFGNVSQFVPYKFITSGRTPEILNTCQESRFVGLKHYAMGLGVEKQFLQPRFKFSSPAETYINWKVDTICIYDLTDLADRDLEDFRQFFDACKIGGLRRLAINLRNCYQLPVALVSALCDSGNTLKEVVFFCTNVWKIRHEVMIMKRATLEFAPVKQDSDEWRGMRGASDLEACRDALTEAFDKLEVDAKAESDTNGEGAKEGEKSFSRPEIKFCKAEVKLFVGDFAEDFGSD